VAKPGIKFKGALELDILSKVIFNDHGFMVDPSQWTKEVGAAMAEQEGLGELTEIHWKVIEFCRNYSAKSGSSPALRMITASVGISTRELFSLFPKGPARKIARISGLESPSSCI